MCYFLSKKATKYMKIQISIFGSKGQGEYMKNLKMIFEEHNSIAKHHKDINIIFEKGKLYIHINDEYFSDNTLKKIIETINYVHWKYNNNKITIVFVFNQINMMDKVTYVIFECICKLLIDDFGHKIEIVYRFGYNIRTYGILSSPIGILSQDDKSIVEKNLKFVKKFGFELYKTHYRRLIKADEVKGTDKISRIYDDIFYFQKSFNLNYERIEEISEVVVELVGNAVEHSQSDCLLDIDIAPNYYNDENQQFCGINIAIVNFSKCLLGDLLQDRIVNWDPNISNKRYEIVKNAYKNHSEIFDENYDEVDFFNISSFQHKVSGRKEKILTGGIGLTKLIKSIEERADFHSCFVNTGNRKIVFKSEYLEYNEDDWLGFNKYNDYLHYPPDPSIFRKSDFYMPGTAYNLNFVMKVNSNE